MQVIQILRADGGVSFWEPAPGVKFDPAQIVAQWAESADPAFLPVVSFAVVDGAVRPSKRFRMAWRHAGGVVRVDMPASRAIRKAELLAERDARLRLVRDKAASADEDGDKAKKDGHQARAKLLRTMDTTLDPRLAALATPEVLDAFMPVEFATAD